MSMRSSPHGWHSVLCGACRDASSPSSNDWSPSNARHTTFNDFQDPFMALENNTLSSTSREQVTIELSRMIATLPTDTLEILVGVVRDMSGSPLVRLILCVCNIHAPLHVAISTFTSFATKT